MWSSPCPVGANLTRVEHDFQKHARRSSACFPRTRLSRNFLRLVGRALFHNAIVLNGSACTGDNFRWRYQIRTSNV